MADFDKDYLPEPTRLIVRPKPTKEIPPQVLEYLKRACKRG